MSSPPADAAQQPHSKSSHAKEHGGTIRGWPQHIQGQASTSRTTIARSYVSPLSRGRAATRVSSAIGAELLDNKHPSLRVRIPGANTPGNEHGQGVEAASADIEMRPATGPSCMLCCFVMGLLLLLRPNCSGLCGVPHEHEHEREVVCASRRASCRPRPRCFNRGPKRGMCRDALLLLLVAWLGVCSANGTIAVLPLSEEGSNACMQGCNGHGMCGDESHGGMHLGVCACDEGWSGPWCQWAVCEPTCGEYGWCDQGSCACEAGFTGADCRTPTVLLSVLLPPSLPPDIDLGRAGGMRVDRAGRAAIESREAESHAQSETAKSLKWLLWAVVLPLCILLVAALVLFYRHYSRMSRDRANLRLSRDRAHLDLQLISHRAQAKPYDLASVADLSSRSGERFTPLAGRAAVSLPPGPPSSAASLPGTAAASLPPDPSFSSAASLHDAAASLPPDPPSSSAATLAVSPIPGPTSSSNGKGKRKARPGKAKVAKVSAKVPLSWAEADRQFYASAAGKAYLASTTTTSPTVASSSAVAPTPWEALSDIERVGQEIRRLGRRWEALSGTESAQINRNGAPSSAPTPAPASPTPLAASDATSTALEDRWGEYWEAKDTRAAVIAAAPPERPALPAPAPLLADQSVEPLVWAVTGQQRHREVVGAACNVAAWTAPRTPSPPGAGPDLVRLVDLAGLTELQDDEVVVALTNHIFDAARGVA